MDALHRTPTRKKGGRYEQAPAWLRWCLDLYIDVVVYLANHVVGHIPCHAVRNLFYRKVMRWRLGRESSIHERLRVLGAPGRVTIGHNTIIGHDFYMGGVGIHDQLVIGNNVNIAMHVFLSMGGHRLDEDFSLYTRPVVIEDHAVIFARVTIVASNIGRGAVVLPGAVVVKDVEPFSIVGGVPAKKVGMREPAQDPSYRLNWRWRFH